MKRKTKAVKQRDRDVEAAFKKHGSNRQFDMFDLSKIFDSGNDADEAGESIEDAVKAACDKYEIQDTGK